MASTNPGNPEGALPLTSVTTANLGSGQAATPGTTPEATPDDLYPAGVPEPTGISPETEQRAEQGESTDPNPGNGVDGEVIVWEARYSKRNFIGRLIVRSLLTIAWVALAIYTWGMGHDNIHVLTWILGAVVAVIWVALVSRIIQAHYSHYYRLTNRRLFLSTGIIERRRDQLELLKVKDVFTRQQGLFDRWLGLGTVVVVPDSKDLPTFYLTGVDDPKQIMDLIWHQARTERATKAIMIDKV